ncbi:hypothetical protein [Tumebacillus permanentifrigoris]|uniref:Uncharacterized protein n=1 Tax=Tumebacillus permanentifrigoris TaxID=378543 RepID=A0A316DAS9_9BACL|nr:hypothetical protein [Tumebacillus permanentifrigoris]PWK13517.1 hypothetical protein C7459_107186 [Tumebacillus permanentifrigoris]
MPSPKTMIWSNVACLVGAFFMSYLTLLLYPELLSQSGLVGVMVGFGCYTAYAIFLAFFCYSALKLVPSMQQMLPTVVLAFLIPIGMYVVEESLPSAYSLRIFSRFYEIADYKAEIRHLIPGYRVGLFHANDGATSEEFEASLPEGFYAIHVEYDLDAPPGEYAYLLKPSFFRGAEQYIGYYEHDTKKLSPLLSFNQLWDQAVLVGKVPDVRIRRDHASFNHPDHSIRFYTLTVPTKSYVIHWRVNNQRVEITSVDVKD